MPRSRLPLTQRHTRTCRRPKSGCDCPWQYRTRDKITGKQVSRSFAGYDEAEAGYLEYMSASPGSLQDRTTTIAQYAPQWLKVGQAKDLSKATISSRERDLHCHVLPYLGRSTMWQLTQDDCWRWDQWMKQPDHQFTTRPDRYGREHVRVGPVSQTSRRSAAEMLHTMFEDWGRSHEMRRGNPVPKGMVKLPPARSTESPPLSRADVEKIARAMEQTGRGDMALMVRMCGEFTGNRYGEILAARLDDLQWIGRRNDRPLLPQLDKLLALAEDEFQARKPTWRVGRQLDYQTRAEVRMKNPRYGPRVLPAPRWVVEGIAIQLRTWPVPRGDYLFVNFARGVPGQPPARGKNGEWLPYTHGAYAYQFTRALKIAGIELPPGQLTHSMRHSRVAQLRDLDLNDKHVGDQIGDSAVSVGRYAKGRSAESMQRIAALDEAARVAEMEPTHRRLKAVQ